MTEVNSLQKIVDWKKEEIKSLPPIRGIEMTLEIGRRHGLHDLESALQEPSMQIIAEVKRRSPSEGEILADQDLVDIATQYEKKVAITGRDTGVTGEVFTNYVLDLINDSQLEKKWQSYQTV